MKREKFDELMADKTVLKVDTIGGGIFKDSNDIVAIQFLFMHAGDSPGRVLPPIKRIFLSTFPFENLIEEVKAYSIVDVLTILANADSYEYALTYNLSINLEQRIIKIIVEDMPNVGERLITQEEIDGIAIPY